MLESKVVLIETVTTVFFRQDGQGTREEYKGKDYRGDLEERERVALRERTKERARR